MINYTLKIDKDVMGYKFKKIYHKGKLIRKITYYNNGVLYKIHNYKDGNVHGKCMVYNENGNISTECEFVDGQMHGEYKSYDKEGNISFTQNYKNDELDGRSQFYCDLIDIIQDKGENHA